MSFASGYFHPTQQEKKDERKNCTEILQEEMESRRGKNVSLKPAGMNNFPELRG
jgi:hypothetical protein